MDFTCNKDISNSRYTIFIFHGGIYHLKIEMLSTNIRVGFIAYVYIVQMPN